nr:hypothetical protein [Tanacetum cinerariifolium]
MSTQQDIYTAGSENHPSMLNKDNYVPWLSRIIRYARSIPNGKMIVDSIENGPYVRRLIAIPREPDLPVSVPESFHEQTNEELTKNDIKRMDADDQAIQTILLGLPEDVYAAIDSCETTKEIWDCVQQMMKGSDIGEQEKKAKLFNEWEKFTSTDGESIESYYHRFMQLMNDLKRNKHFPENIASNLKFLNNLQPEWKRHVTIVRQTKNLHEADFTQIYDFLKMNQDENQQGYNAWQNGGIQVAHNANQNAGVQSGGNQNGLVVVPRIANQNGTGNVIAARAEGTGNENQARCYNCKGLGQIARNCTARPRRRDAAYLQTQLLIAQKEEAGIQLQAEEFDFMAATDKAPVYDTDGLAEVQLNDNCYDNEIFNMFTQEEQYTDLLEPIPEPQLVPQNDNHVTSIAPSMVYSRGTVEISFDSNEETRAHQETVYLNLVDQVAQEDKFLDKEVDLEAKIKDLENILLKRDQTVQTMRMFNPKPDSFYHPNQKMALEEHDPPAVYDLEETLELAQESREIMRFLKKEIKPANYAKIDHLSGVFVPQSTKSKEEVQHFEIQFLQEAAKFVRDFKSLAKEADESLDKQKSLELEIKRLLKASVSHDIMSIVQNGFVNVPSDLRIELDEFKYDKISYDKAYNDMQQKVKRLQAQLRDLKGKSSDTLVLQIPLIR